jgi:hypothetical protein
MGTDRVNGASGGRAAGFIGLHLSKLLLGQTDVLYRDSVGSGRVGRKVAPAVRAVGRSCNAVLVSKLRVVSVACGPLGA